ncbi:hypothetical protein O0Q50_30635 [Priestia aryabhattai]|uniref:5-bromo-4-chloroindolyl phosphate hydrolysis protein n=1 Tax=Priestia aryabhattai TaxID=412384 RepID=A0AAX6NI85_PRIAR|nr:hypothetical protein [Priestia aryabhattai]MDU9695562.1 hypothetical protein [Priestia aryabhattai]
MDNRQEIYNQLKDNEKDIIMYISITILFVYVSCLLLIGSAELKDVYAAASSIAGGVIGGLITLQGVKRTIYAQREITLEGVKATISAQKDFESQKLIPQKLVKLHELDKKIVEFRSDFLVLRIMWKMLEQSKQPSQELVEEIKNYRAFLYELGKKVSIKEYEFVDISSQIDIDTYKKIKWVFDGIEEEIKVIAGNSKFRDLVYKEYKDYKDNEKENLIELVRKLAEQIKELDNQLRKNSDDLESIIPLKLEEYEKEML